MSFFKLDFAQCKYFGGFMHPQAVELDPTMLNLAEDYFAFSQDKSLKVIYANLNPLCIYLYFQSYNFGCYNHRTFNYNFFV